MMVLSGSSSIQRPARSPLRRRNSRFPSPLKPAFVPQHDDSESLIQPKPEREISARIVDMYRSAALESSPLSIATEIQLLIRTLVPIPSPDSTATMEEPPFVISPSTARPIFPDAAKMVQDESLLSVLANGVAMNGTNGRDGKMGVFSALQAISEQEKSTDVMFDVPVDFGEPLKGTSSPIVKQKSIFRRASKASHTPPPSESTKLSCEITWWGYRLYLPPPVIAYLSQKTMHFAKRAQTISGILSWVLQFIPIAVLPPEAQVIVILLQRIVPFIGYIGSFVSWMWGEVLSYDTGHGVTLTATWLLPVALIPGTLELDRPSTLPSGSPSKSSGSEDEEEGGKWWGFLGHA